jgi:hypothetical protein
MDYGDGISASTGIITAAMASCPPPYRSLHMPVGKAGLEWLVSFLLNKGDVTQRVTRGPNLLRDQKSHPSVYPRRSERLRFERILCLLHRSFE